MHFRVEFYTNNDKFVYKEEKPEGLKAIELCEEVNDLAVFASGYQINYEDNQGCFNGRTSVELRLNRIEAKESGLFDNAWKARVKIPEKSLNKYIDILVLTDNYIREKGAYTFKLKAVFNSEERLLDDWRYAGYPGEIWDPSLAEEKYNDLQER